MNAGLPVASIETVFLLPERRRFAGQGLSPAVAGLLGRAERLADGVAGEREQLARHFDILPRGWPMAAIGRQHESGDASSGQSWLRADPVHVRPDMAGARLMAWGNLDLATDEADAFMQALQPIFGDAGLPITRTTSERWYVALSRELSLPAFAHPADSLGEDLLKHLPEGPEGRRWRLLLTEAQVLLHNHPLNAKRMSRGQLPVNSLWFWGAGTLPISVRSRVRRLESDDFELLALAALVSGDAAGVEPAQRLVDLRGERQWLAVEPMLLSANMPLLLDFADGARWRVDIGQRWRFWRRPLKSLA